MSGLSDLHDDLSAFDHGDDRREQRKNRGQKCPARRIANSDPDDRNGGLAETAPTSGNEVLIFGNDCCTASLRLVPDCEVRGRPQIKVRDMRRVMTEFGQSPSQRRWQLGVDQKSQEAALSTG